jgi:hypothetical protein
MRRFVISTLALMLVLGSFATPARAGYASDIDATVQKAIDAFNAADLHAFIATGAPGSQTVMDDFGIHYWSGPAALGSWFRDFFAMGKQAGLADIRVKVSPPKFSAIDGSRAWGTYPTIYTYRDNGLLKTETGVLVFTLEKINTGWRILGMAWGRSA